MPVSHRFNCIFVHIPKTAGSSIEKFMAHAAGYERPREFWDYWGKIKTEHRDRLKLREKDVDWERQNRLQSVFHHLSARALKQIIDPELWNRYYKFAIVRNPFDRIVSFYEYHKKTGERGNTKGKGFKEWFWHEEFAPSMIPYLYDEKDNLLVDKLIRFEDLETGFREACNEMGVGFTKLPHEKKSERRDYKQYYDTQMRQFVEEKLAGDLATFSYGF
jgi:hypothetical protein